MIWANFLHFYQPAGQQRDILRAVAAQCYIPLFERISKAKKLKLTLNITGSLLELFDKYGYTGLIDLLKSSLRAGTIELTGSCKYHAFLPLLPEKEAVRQIELNTETLKKYLGNNISLNGFFPPEMGYAPQVAALVKKLGFKWIILDEIAYAGGGRWPDCNRLYRVTETGLNVVFRNRRVSNVIMSALIRSGRSLRKVTADDIREKKYVVAAMDGETFGHHRPGLENLLFDIFEDTSYRLCTISELFETSELAGSFENVTPVSSTWASSPLDIKNGTQFLSWLDKDNEIHGWQWEFVKLVMRLVEEQKDKDLGAHSAYEDLRRKLDTALASDHFWWASAKPWWSLEMIEDGAFRLLDIARSIPGLDKDVLERCTHLYNSIISTAFAWQREGKIREMAGSRESANKLPFKDKTLGVGGAEEGVYRAFVDMIKKLEKDAAGRSEYEQAILWRDAAYKLDKKHDIYDTINAIDLLRQKIPHEKVEKIIEKYKKKYSLIRSGQPEQRG